MKSEKKIKAAVLGCTGLIGQQFIKMLDGHPWFETAALTASARSVGKAFGEAADWAVGGAVPSGAARMMVLETSIRALLGAGVSVVFSALPAAAAKGFERDLAAHGLHVFSNAGAHRQDQDVPILIPEVNAEHLDLVRAQKNRGAGFLVANSNCSTSGLVMALKPLRRLGLRSAVVSTYQSLSGAGRRGVASLDILANVVPFIKDEEEKIEREVRKILGDPGDSGVVPAAIDVTASCCRVATRFGHLESVIAELDEDVDIQQAAQAFASFHALPQDLGLPTAPERPLIVRPEPDRPQPLLDADAGSPARAAGMAVTIGRIRKKGKRLGFYLLVHNTVRGAAGTCLLSAEALEADRIGIVTDESFDNATARLAEVRRNLQKELLPVLERGDVPVVTGYFGRTAEGKVTTFGRNGSDYSAAVIAQALGADRLEIWKDVDGFMSADPKVVSGARPVDRLSYYEAAELSYFGASVM